MNNENSENKNESEVLMHFVIPTDWKGTLRGLFWINIGIIGLFLSLVFGSIALGIIDFRPLCIIPPIILFIAIYLLIRYASIKYDRIKEPIKVWIKEDCIVYKKGYELELPFTNIKRVSVTIDDKKARLRAWYSYIIDGDVDGWIYGLKRDNVEKGKYKYYVEKYWIPSMKLIIQQIKKYNPGVEVEWQDVRKKYR